MRKTICIVLALAMLSAVPGYGFAESKDLITELIPSHQNTTAQNNNISDLQANNAPMFAESAEDTEWKKATDITLMIYMCGSTMEGVDSFGDECYLASMDIYEICTSGLNTDKINAVLYAGGCSQWGLDAIQDGSCGIYQLYNGKIKTLVNDGKTYNMGDPSTLSSFLQYSYDNFPAEHYALILWDHGGGALEEVCHDVNFPREDSDSDGLTMMELNAALAKSPFAEQKLDWIGFDACLMSALETASVVAPYAQYMVASEETEYGEGWNYSFLKDMDKDRSPAETGARIVDCYSEIMAVRHPTHNNTLACLDLSKLPAVMQNLDAYFKDINMQPGDYGAYREYFMLRRGLLAYGLEDNRAKSFDLVDLKEMMDGFLNSGIGDRQKGIAVETALKDCVQSCVPGERNGKTGGTGLSVYFPCENIRSFPLRIADYQELRCVPEYASFIEAFGNTLYANHYRQSDVVSENSLTDYQLSNGSGLWNNVHTKVVPGAREGRSRFTLALTPEQKMEFFSARLLAFQRAKDEDLYRLVAIEEENLESQRKQLEQGVIDGEYTHVNLFVLDSLNGSEDTMLPIPYELRSDGLYEVEAELINAKGNHTPAHLVFPRRIETLEISPEDIEVYLYDSVLDAFTPRRNADLSSFTEVIFPVQYKREALDENETLLPYDSWEDWGDCHEIHWVLNSDSKLSFLEDKLDMSTLYFSFEITDMFNNVYLSKLASMTERGSGPFKISYYDDGRKVGVPALLRLDNPRVQNSGSNAAFISLDIINLAENEPLFIATNLRINDVKFEATDLVRGSGAKGGLLYEEEKTLSFLVDIEGGVDAIETISFDLKVLSTDGEQLHSTPVLISR